MNKENQFNRDVEYYLLREIASRSACTQVLTPDGIKEKKLITLNFIKRKMKEYERLEEEIGKARQEIGEEVA